MGEERGVEHAPIYERLRQEISADAVVVLAVRGATVSVDGCVSEQASQDVRAFWSLLRDLSWPAQDGAAVARATARAEQAEPTTVAIAIANRYIAAAVKFRAIAERTLREVAAALATAAAVGSAVESFAAKLSEAEVGSVLDLRGRP